MFLQLSGTIPSSLGSLTGLLTLCVRHAECRNCAVLRRFTCANSYLDFNQLSGTIPASLGSLTGLTRLCVRRDADFHCTALRCPACVLSSLNNNQLSGTVPASLGSLTMLQSLCVRRAVRCGSPVQCAEAFRCSLTSLPNNQLSGSIPSSFGSLPRLQYLCVCRDAGRPCTPVRQAGVLTPHLSPGDSSFQLPVEQQPLRHCARWAHESVARWAHAAHRRRPACLPGGVDMRRQQRRDCMPCAG